MTEDERLQLTKRLDRILASNQNKDNRLVIFMNDLEGAYGIPAVRNEDYERLNPHVMKLYRTAAAERNL